MRIPVDKIQGIEFLETPTKQSSQGQLHPFDIIYDLSLKDGIDHKRYCVLLLRTLFRLKKKERIRFLDYQCHLIQKPVRWLNSLYLLLEYNIRVLIRQNKSNHIAELMDLVEEKRNALFYIRDSSNNLTLTNKEAEKSKKYRWRGTTSQLVHMYYQTLHKRHKGNTLLDLTVKEMIELIQDRYVKIDGSPFNAETLRNYLKPSKSDKHPNYDQQIQIPESNDE